MPWSEPNRNRLYDLGFTLVETFSAMEVTAVLVANGRIAASLGIPTERASQILNSYLYPLFASMILALLLSRAINRRVGPAPLFLAGLLAFAAGNVLCAGAAAPAPFYAGRILMGLGAAASFMGQLWTLCLYHHERITRPLVWGEVGAALGIVLGPVVGALFAQHGANGWRAFFVLNASLALATAVCAFVGLQGRRPLAPPADSARPTRVKRNILWILTAWQVTVSLLIVGGELFYSDYMQTRVGRSALFVGAMTMIASLGAIAGSVLAARWTRWHDWIPVGAVLTLLGAIPGLGLCLALGHHHLVGLPIFIAGLAMGAADVSIYANLVEESGHDQFLSRSMIYLIGMQVGNALGVQAVGLAEYHHLGVGATIMSLVLLPVLVTLWIGYRGWGTVMVDVAPRRHPG